MEPDYQWPIVDHRHALAVSESVGAQMALKIYRVLAQLKRPPSSVAKCWVQRMPRLRTATWLLVNKGARRTLSPILFPASSAEVEKTNFRHVVVVVSM